MPRSHLRALADRLGIVSAYTDATGVDRTIDDEAREALVAALGFPTGDEARAREAREALEAEERRRLLPPASVLTDLEAELTLHGGPELRGTVSWEAELREEGGGATTFAGRARAREGQVRLRLPARPEPGYHRLHVALRTPSGERTAETALIAAPESCYTVHEAIGGQPVFGIWSNLYTVRSGRNWGIGDLGDLGDLVRWAAGRGAHFLGVNPLHALWNRGTDVSPYSPVSRVYRNVLYLDVEAVPELADAAEAREQIASEAFRHRLSHLRGTERVDYEAVLDIKLAVLRQLHRAFAERHRDRGTGRGEAYRAYRERQGPALERFARFLALAEELERGGHSRYWREWPEQFRDPCSPAVEEFAERHRELVDFHRWVQFELDGQLAAAAGAAREGGMRLGLYQDLAIGTSDGGSDPWAFPDLFAAGATVGAPPDVYSAAGQDWGLPPLNPFRLAARGFDYWIGLVRSALAHAGALRIDHAMGLLRLFWIPRGRPATEGAYVGYPSRELLGILALESRRHRAVVVGEDLGTVPPGFGALLARWGILSSQVMLFERDETGAFRPSHGYSRRALVTSTTHDHVPIPGFWQGAELALKRQVGLIPDDAALERQVRERERDRGALVERLRVEGIVDRAPESPAELVAAVHGFLRRTPAPLVGLSLDDLGGETEPVNVPGVGPDRYPSWSRKMRLALEDLPDDPAVQAGLRAARPEAEGGR